MWCAYPDPSCPGGYRYSNQSVGDGLGGMCVPGDAGVGDFTLTLNISGEEGMVVSTPSGLACTAGMCSSQFAPNTQVQLAASTTSSTAAFLGWSQDCTGGSACMVTMDADHTVGASFGEPGQALWATQFGGPSDDLANGITVDASGDLIVVGQFQSTINAGGTMLTSAGGRDIFVLKLSATDGSITLAKRFGGTGDDVATAVAVDATGNIYVAGYFSNSVDFGGGALTSAGGFDGFLLQLDSSGSYGWAKQFGSTGFDFSEAVAVQGSSVVVTGFFTGAPATINGTSYPNGGAEDAYIVQYATSGANGWVTTIDGAGNDEPHAVAIDAAGDVVVAGAFTGTTNFGGGSVTSAGLDDAFFAKYSGASGGYLFAKRLGGTSGDIANAVAVDSSKNIFVTGTFSGMVDFGGPSQLNGNGADMFLAKYSLAGAYSWAKSFGDTTATVAPESLSVNASGDIACAGHFCGTLNLGGLPLSNAGGCPYNDDMFAARFAGADGSHLNSVQAGGAMTDLANGVTETPDGRFFVAGAFQGFAQFGQQGLTSAGGYDGVVLGLAPL